MKTLLVLFTLILTSSAFATAAGWKDIGGGNGIGGTLLDTYEAGAETELDGDDLYQLVMSQVGERFSQLPMLASFSQRLLNDPMNHKTWFLDDRKLSNDCLNQSTLDLSKASIIACQNDVEVRVNRHWWLSATPALRGQLLVHEILTAMALEIGNNDSVHAGVVAIYKTPFDAVATRNRLLTSGFVFFPTTAELAHTQTLIERALPALCTAQNSQQALLASSAAVTKMMTTDDTSLVAIVTGALFAAIDRGETHVGCTPVSDLTASIFSDLGWFATIKPRH